ncbi:hypothetical protein LZ31DRAFT_538480 [Colletotrichum somersetense]|nr:hypothetical protein LZ31DRAFT_538480 [Colletotrichum somersetense]
MLAIYPFLVLWSLSFTSGAFFTWGRKAKPIGSSLPPGRTSLPPGRSHLRDANDIYNVEVKGDDYHVYTPYYWLNEEGIVRMIFPDDPGQDDRIIIYYAFNDYEKPHKDGSARLHLSEMIEAVAENHARRPLTSINIVIIETVVELRTAAVINEQYTEWKAQQFERDPKAPEFAVDPSNKFWARFATTPFFKAVNHAFESSRKAVVKLDVKKGDRGSTNLWFYMGPLR